MNVLEIIVDFYVVSGTKFNGIPLLRLVRETGRSVEELKEELIPLIRDSSVSINFGDRHPNAHVKALAPEPPDEQIAKLTALDRRAAAADDTEEPVIEFPGPDGEMTRLFMSCGSPLSHVCLYPEHRSLRDRIDVTSFAGQPFTLRLALGEPQLSFENFDLAVLETYRNDPRYHYRTNDIGGSLWIHDEHYESDSVPEADKALLEHFGFSYNENLERAVAGFLRDLSRLTPEHQRIWQARIVKGRYFLHPDYGRSVAGEWPEKLNLFDAFLMELEVTNGMCQKMGKSHLFRDAPAPSDRPREFAFLLRPTVKEFQGFVSLLDKLLSESLNRDFFKGDLELTEDIERSDGKVEVRQKGTIALLGVWVRKKVRLKDPKPFDAAVATIKEVRKLRQRPAHALDDNRFDRELFKEQRELMVRAYGAVRVLRLLFANHPSAKLFPVPDELFNGEIWPF